MIRSPRAPSARWTELERRRAAVVELLAVGLTDRAIARELGVSQFWVAATIARERERVGAESRTALAVAWVLSPDCTFEQRARVRARIAGGE